MQWVTGGDPSAHSKFCMDVKFYNENIHINRKRLKQNKTFFKGRVCKLRQ